HVQQEAVAHLNPCVFLVFYLWHWHDHFLNVFMNYVIKQMHLYELYTINKIQFIDWNLIF
ncbi:hypothetical protein ACJX0J_033978, partial [Zea mays]